MNFSVDPINLKNDFQNKISELDPNYNGALHANYLSNYNNLNVQASDINKNNFKFNVSDKVNFSNLPNNNFNSGKDISFKSFFDKSKYNNRLN